MTATAGPIDLATVERDAMVRRAQERLVKIDDMRAAYRLQQSGKTQREIAEMLHTTQPRVHRMLKAMENRPDVETPEELILRATTSETSRELLVQRLSAYEYTFKEYAPYPFEGAAPGTWDQVTDAYIDGFLTKAEFEQVKDAVRPPQA